jgi:hypothetical protein
MKISANFSALRKTKWYEYAMRFLLGGTVTVVAGFLAKHYGLVFGGLFLAFPAIFPASATLADKHERQKKQRAGIPQTTRGRLVAGGGCRRRGAWQLGARHFCLDHLEAAATVECGNGFYCGGKRLALRFVFAMVAPQKALESRAKIRYWLNLVWLSIFSSNSV